MNPIRPGSRQPATIALAAVLLLCVAGCAGKKARRPPAAPPRPAPVPAKRGETPQPPAVCPPPATQRPGSLPPAPVRGKAQPSDRIVRVMLGAPARTVVVEGCPVRAWRENGTVAGESNGSITLTADGNRIRAGGAAVDGPVDVGADSAFSVAGHRLPAGRARVVNRQGKLVAIATLPLEEYVAAVLSREGSAAFRPAALSALAVAVRTYAVNAMAKPRDPDFDLFDGVDDQVFDGFDRVFPQFRAAVEETRGLLLRYGDATARANYHSTCGGRTESAADAWGRAYPYLVSVACEDCRESPAYRWECRLTGDEGRRISLQLGLRGRGDLRFEVAARTATGRASRIRMSSAGASREAAGAAFRQAAGTTRVKSLQMEIERAGDGWKVTGTGYGHGVGLCQWGADGMARRGCDFREILARYYPGTRVEGGAP